MGRTPISHRHVVVTVTSIISSGIISIVILTSITIDIDPIP
jgi:hypothetical protein